eukprot:CAMPEP_0176363908 /NCGR_PEP_ID=MMETSP0126-20121128/19440_1 /TAXON_ID=141414 ORGANISM="Strombidinopsis acuminatum, Strain SPMC142" /NCGR_SAMPLE_ID=MMETSP0126 /ASSEMBLY_ACC=CAM_ASM_000229 /LENGTH=49 /DNA_ID=CAMNT_0017720379 /DNA_START=295 /DNA_END=444 /DNA_ORIENTATION=+
MHGFKGEQVGPCFVMQKPAFKKGGTSIRKKKEETKEESNPWASKEKVED